MRCPPYPLLWQWSLLWLFWIFLSQSEISLSSSTFWSFRFEPGTHTQRVFSFLVSLLPPLQWLWVSQAVIVLLLQLVSLASLFQYLLVQVFFANEEGSLPRQWFFRISIFLAPVEQLSSFWVVQLLQTRSTSRVWVFLAHLPHPILSSSSQLHPWSI